MKAVNHQITRIVLLVIVLALTAVLVYRRTHPAQSPAISGSGNNLVLQVHAISVTNNLALGDFVIPAKSTHDVRIGPTEDQMRNPRLTGVFSTAGSPGIKVMLLDEDQYNRFRNNSAPSEYAYLSGTLTNGTIDAAIPHPGIYYLVFDNSSSDSSASVKANVAIRGEIVHVDSGASEKGEKSDKK